MPTLVRLYRPGPNGFALIPERIRYSTATGLRPSIEASLLVMKLLCAASSKTLLARVDLHSDRTLAMAVFRKTNGDEARCNMAAGTTVVSGVETEKAAAVTFVAEVSVASLDLLLSCRLVCWAALQTLHRNLDVHSVL